MYPEELNDPDRQRRPRQATAAPEKGGRGQRTTESALAFPAWRQFFLLIGRAIRLRCPHCGAAPVLKPYATVRDRCASCRFNFTRSSDSYYSGAMLTNLAVAELLFAIVFVAALLLTWPNVPWDTLAWAMPLGVALAPMLLLPFAKVAWLTFDVMFRPVTPDEFDPVG